MTLSLGFTSKITPIKPVNDEMTLCKCYIMHPGKNNNKSDIPDTAVEDALPTLFNIPVVGHIIVDEDTGEIRMGGHDREIKRAENGKYYFKSLTVPYGTVPYQEGVHYEEVEEANGTKHTYLVADIILWTGRYPQLLEAKYGDDVFFNQSMEIKPLETTTSDNGYTKVNKYRYSALCLLGKSDDPKKNVSPCFPSSRVEPYHFSEVENWQELFEEFQAKLADTVGNGTSFNLQKGGENALTNNNTKVTLYEEEAKPAEVSDVPAAGEDPAEETPATPNVEPNDDNLQDSDNATENTDQPAEPAANGDEAILDAVENKESSPEVATDETHDDGGDNDGNDTANGGEFAEGEDASHEPNEENRLQFELTSEETRRMLSDAISGFCVWNDVLYKSYWLCDFDSKYAYVGFYQASEEGTSSGYQRIAYTSENNKVELAPDSLENVRLVWMTEEEASKADRERNEYAALVEYKRAKEEAEKRQQYAEIISEFSDLSEVEEYQHVVGMAMEFESAEALKEKLYAVRGKCGIAKKKDTVLKFPILSYSKEKQATAEEEFFAKYLPEAIKNK